MGKRRRVHAWALIRSSFFATFVTAALLMLALFGVVACDTKDDAANARPLSKLMPQHAAPGEIPSIDWPAEPTHIVRLEIEGYGEIEIGLFAQLAPANVDHFLALSTNGIYQGSTFHRVIADFMIQGGDPTTKRLEPGEAAPTYGFIQVKDEFSGVPHLRGVLSMANRGKPRTAGTQFFILQRDRLELDGRYTAFGRVQSGMEVVDAIAAVETDEFGRWGSRDRPLEYITLTRVDLLAGKMPSTASGAAPGGPGRASGAGGASGSGSGGGVSGGASPAAGI